MARIGLVIGLCVGAAVALDAAPAQSCTGDCDADGEVVINEIISCVSIVLGSLPLSNCTACDSDGDGEVFVTDIISSINISLGVAPCTPPLPSTPTITPTLGLPLPSTATPTTTIGDPLPVLSPTPTVTGTLPRVPSPTPTATGAPLKPTATATHTNQQVCTGDICYMPGTCGDNWCDEGETAQSCPLDCFASCYGAPEICQRAWNDVVVAGTHNSNSSYAYGFLPLFADQDYSLTKQLTDGIRHFDIDIDYCTNDDTRGTVDDICLCHGDDKCLGGSQPAADGLGEIVSWLNAHPSEIISIAFEASITRSDLDLILGYTGLADLAYTIPVDVQARHEKWGWTWNNLAKTGNRVIFYAPTTAKICSNPNRGQPGAALDVVCEDDETCSPAKCGIDPDYTYCGTNAAVRKFCLTNNECKGANVEECRGSDTAKALNRYLIPALPFDRIAYGAVDPFETWVCTGKLFGTCENDPTRACAEDSDCPSGGCSGGPTVSPPGMPNRHHLQHQRSAVFAAPDPCSAECANAETNIINHFDKCMAAAGRKPQAVVVTFYDLNTGLFTAINKLNGLNHLSVPDTNLPVHPSCVLASAVPPHPAGIPCECHISDDCDPSEFCLTEAGFNGQCVTRFDNGVPCILDNQCKSGICNGICTPECGDGRCNAVLEKCGDSNSGLECNKDCGKCANGAICTSNEDCTSNACNFGFCVANASLNLGVPCSTSNACKSAQCTAGLCAPRCGDGSCNAPEICGDSNSGLECNADCGKCANGTPCLSGSDSDCQSGLCNLLVCRAVHSGGLTALCNKSAYCRTDNCVAGACAARCGDATCEGGIIEKCGDSNSGIECIADCGKCVNGAVCTSNADCTSNACNFGFCVASASLNLGAPCSTSNACKSAQCTAGVCAPRCGDGTCNAPEICGDSNSGLECNADCGKCGNGTPCPSGSDSDCQSGLCNLLVCRALHSGGLAAPCNKAAYCRTDNCVAGVCAARCGDGVCEGGISEKCGDSNSGIECITDCGKCTNGAVCTSNSDCSSNACNFGFCVAANSLGLATPCSTNNACRSASCVAGFCAPSCGDGSCNAPEICGDSNSGFECNRDCGKCNNGTPCGSNADCVSNYCSTAFKCCGLKKKGQLCNSNAECCVGPCTDVPFDGIDAYCLF